MTNVAGVLGKPSLFHQVVAASALGLGFFQLVTPYAAVIRTGTVHRLLKRDTVAFVAPDQRMTLAARCEFVVVAGATGVGGLLVVDMGKRHCIELTEFEVRFGGAEQHEVGLTPLQARRLLDNFNSQLLLRVVTSAARHRADSVVRARGRHLQVAVQARLVCRQSE